MHSLGILPIRIIPAHWAAVQNILQVAEQRSMACVLDDALRNLPQFKEAPAFSTAQPEAILALGGDRDDPAGGGPGSPYGCAGFRR